MNPRSYGDFGTCACAPSPLPQQGPEVTPSPGLCAGTSTLRSCMLVALCRGRTRVNLADARG